MKKRCSLEKSILTGEDLASKGKAVMSLARTSTFFLLGVDKYRSYSWRITIHWEIFPLIYHRLRKYCMGLEYATTLVVRSRIYGEDFGLQGQILGRVSHHDCTSGVDLKYFY
jgi:hypothetical protein